MEVGEQRQEAILRLLRTRHDHLPEPIRRAESESGFVHGARAVITCGDCLANGRVLKTCETCGGRGYTEEPRPRDPYATEAVLPYGFDLSRHEAARERDRQLEMLERQLARPMSTADELAAANAQPYAWELARRRMYRLFDYAALDRALELLHAAHPGMSPFSRHGLAFLDERLPNPLRAPEPQSDKPRVVGPVARAAGDRARAVRDDDVVAAIRAGTSTAEVAARVGLSVSQVNRIVRSAAVTSDGPSTIPLVRARKGFLRTDQP